MSNPCPTCGYSTPPAEPVELGTVEIVDEWRLRNLLLRNILGEGCVAAEEKGPAQLFVADAPNASAVDPAIPVKLNGASPLKVK